MVRCILCGIDLFECSQSLCEVLTLARQVGPKVCNRDVHLARGRIAQSFAFVVNYTQSNLAHELLLDEMVGDIHSHLTS